MKKRARDVRPQLGPDILRAARQAARRAYAPYSGFTVGAVLLDSGGVLFSGANIENGAFPLGICAERVALQIWKQAGGSAIRRIAIYTPTPTPTPPCGLCRDALVGIAPEADLFLIYRGGVRGPFRCDSWLPAQTRGDE